MSKYDLLEALASEIESMDLSPIDKQLETYLAGELSDQEIDDLYALAKYDNELEMKLALYKPVNAQTKRDIENEVITLFFDGDGENSLDPNVSQLHINSSSKLRGEKDSFYQSAISYLRKHYIALVASPVLAVFSSLFVFNLMLTNDHKMTDYNMEIFGSNQQYRNSTQPSVQLNTNDKPLEFYPENQMVIILRPNHSTPEELDVKVFIEDKKNIVTIDVEKERSEFGSFKITPKPNSLSRFSGSEPVNLIAIISKQNILPNIELVRKTIADGNYNSQLDWVLLEKTIVISNNNQ